MREILFRGKRQDNGKWIDGSFVKYTDYDGDKVYLIYASNGNPNNIIPETIGQFTGLTDKNGKKIFEGDFLKYKLKERINDVYIYGHVVYNQDTCEFVVSSIVEEFIIPDKDFFNDIEDSEIIGNIHDNPDFWRNSNGQN